MSWAKKTNMSESVSFTPDPLAPHIPKVLDLELYASIQSVIKLISLGVLETSQDEKSLKTFQNEKPLWNLPYSLPYWQ